MSDYDDDEELKNYSQVSKKGKKSQALKRGNKSSQTSSVETARNALFECLEYEGKATKQSSKGVLDRHAPPYWTRITVNKGTHFHTMGFSHNSTITLYPEEAAFLVSRNALVVTDQEEKTLDFQDFCEILCDPDTDGWISFDKYQVYAYLKRLGYIVQRSKPAQISTVIQSNISNPDSVSIWRLFFDKLSSWIYKNKDFPLVWNYKYTNYRAIYSTLQIIPSSPWYKPFYQSLCRSFDWDVYKPRASWKKKDPGPPDFRIVVNNIHDPMPSLHEQNQLFSQLEAPNYNYQPLRNVKMKEYGPTFVMALVGDAEGISYLRMVGDSLADIVDLT